jgi:hypothetical protein
MPDPRPAALPPPPPPPTPTQFSLRFLFVVVTIVALISPLLPMFGMPMAGVLLPWLLSVATPICLVTAAIYCRGRRQTFFLGAAGAALMAVFSGRAFTMATGLESLLWAAALLATNLTCGFLALATRLFIERRGWHHPSGGENNGLEN